MLCGQGSIGKSTFGKNLIKYLPSDNISFIRMDDVVGKNHLDKNSYDYYFSQYIEKIQKAIDINSEYIIIDLSNDSKNIRKKTLNYLNFYDKSIYFITISLRPGTKNIIKWDKKRKKIFYMPKEKKERIKKIYDNFQFPKKEEFLEFNFLSISNLVIDNSNLNASIKTTLNNIIREVK